MRACRVIPTLAVFFGLTLCLGSARADDPNVGSINIFNGSTVVEALNSTAWSVKVDADLMDAPTISGHVTATGGTGNDIEVVVLTESEYVNWRNNHTVTPIYNSGQVTAADVNARLPGTGTYYVVLSNLFSTFTPKTVEGSLRMTWQPGPAMIATRQTARNSVVLSVLLVVVGSAVLGGCVVAVVTQRKKKAEPESVKRAA